MTPEYRLSSKAVLFFLIASALLFPASAEADDLKIDADFPGGNIVVDRIEGDDVFAYPDLRDTQGAWFYWCCRVRGAAGRTLTFHLTRYTPVGVRGPAVSLDGGRSWQWLGKPKDSSTFTYAFPKDANDVRLGFGMTYTAEHLDRFLKGLPEDAPVRRLTLCKSRKERTVPRLHVGKIDGEPRFRVLITARHHACEMMASYAVEGIIQAALADDPTGKWFRENVELLVVPMVDYDGVEDGDQGKNRRPRDHNRDYDGESRHLETSAIRALVPEWSGGKLTAMLDMHCPAARGKDHEVIHQVYGEDREPEQTRFGKALEGVRKGPLVYRQADDLVWGKSWNTAKNYAQGMSSSRWAGGLPGIRLATTIELPYANASGQEVNADTARAFGKDVAAGLRAYLEAGK